MTPRARSTGITISSSTTSDAKSPKQENQAEARKISTPFAARIILLQNYPDY